MKTIVIARHAKSDWATGFSDHDRPLNGRGKVDAPKMGRALNDLEFKPDLILSSSAVRARTTAEAVAKEVNYLPTLRVDPKLYEASYGMIAATLQSLPDSLNNVILFGHNPILEQLAKYLLQMQGGIIIPTAGMVCLDLDSQKWADLNPASCSLKWFLIPKLLG